MKCVSLDNFKEILTIYLQRGREWESFQFEWKWFAVFFPKQE